jgi:hypothetical protein
VTSAYPSVTSVAPDTAHDSVTSATLSFRIDVAGLTSNEPISACAYLSSTIVYAPSA